MKKELAVVEIVENKILNIRGLSVMLDRDLALLYGVEVRTINQAIKRNIKRFPEDFMFRLTKEEVITFCDNLRLSKFSPSLPYVFTEQGVAMLSSVLKSERAIEINIQIMRAFIAIRQYALKMQNAPEGRLRVLEKALLTYIEANDKRVEDIVNVLNTMLEAEQKPAPRKIGFRKED